MPAKKSARKSAPKPGSVGEYIQKLTPAKQKQAQAIRRIILGADSKITEEIKWNAPSYALGEHFLTFNAWATDDVQLIFHHGPKRSSDNASAISDPGGHLEWLAADRARMRFKGMKEVQAKRKALQAIIKQWIKVMRKG